MNDWHLKYPIFHKGKFYNIFHIIACLYNWRLLWLSSLSLATLHLCILHQSVSRNAPTQTRIFTGPVESESIPKQQATPSNGEISKDLAIRKAIYYCSTIHSRLRFPSYIRAYYLTEGEAIRELNIDKPSISAVPVWLVLMDGVWEHEVPMHRGSQIPPVRFTHCNVIINAQTAMMITITNWGSYSFAWLLQHTWKITYFQTDTLMIVAGMLGHLLTKVQSLYTFKILIMIINPL